MKLFPNGLLGGMMLGSPVLGAQGFGAQDAADLVQRTLAQHGLASPPIVQGTAQGTPAMPQGARFDSGSFTCAAGQRDYMLYTPASGRNGLSGLVVMLHGCTQTPQDFATGTDMNRHAEQHGLGVIYPAQGRGANAQSCWNWFSRADQRRDRGEPAILSALTRQLAADHGVPKGRAYVAGLSAGGAMAVILGTVYPDLYAAVGAHSGLPYGAANDLPSAFAAMGGQPLAQDGPGAGGASVIVFHGGDDTTVHPDNGVRIARTTLPTGMAQLETVETGQSGGRSYTRTLTTATGPGAADQPVVEHWAIAGLGHAWSGGQAAGSYADAKGPDASAEMVRFFLSDDRAAG